jgi:hypothetical protein
MPSSVYQTWSVTAGEIPTTAQWNILGTNDSSMNTGAGFNDAILTSRHFTPAVSPIVRFQQTFANMVSSGGVWTQTSGTAGAMSALIAYIQGFQISLNAIASHSFTASKDTYIDVDYQANIYYLEQTVGGTPQPLTANSVRIAKIVTDSSNIVSIIQYGTDGIGNLIYNLTPTPKHFVVAYRATNDLVLAAASWNNTPCDSIRQLYGVSYTAGNSFVTINRAGLYKVGFITRINDAGGAGTTNLLARAVLHNSDDSIAGTGIGAPYPMAQPIGGIVGFEGEIYCQAGQRIVFQTYSSAWQWRADGEATLSGDDKAWALKFWVSEV